MTGFCNFALIVLLLIPFSGMGSKINGEDDPHIQFMNFYKHQYKIMVETVEGEAVTKKSFRISSKGLENFQSYGFRSIDHIKGKKGFFLRFRLSVYGFENQRSAAIAFKKFVEEQKNTEEYMRSKSPMLLLIKGRVLYILDGSCLYSRKNMDAIELKLINILFPEKLLGNKAYLKRLCGGFFQKINSI